MGPRFSRNLANTVVTHPFPTQGRASLVVYHFHPLEVGPSGKHPWQLEPRDPGPHPRLSKVRNAQRGRRVTPYLTNSCPGLLGEEKWAHACVLLSHISRNFSSSSAETLHPRDRDSFGSNSRPGVLHATFCFEGFDDLRHLTEVESYNLCLLMVNFFHSSFRS